MARAAKSNNSSSEEETARIAAARALMLEAVYYSDGQNMRFFGRNTTSVDKTSGSDSSSLLYDRGDVPPVMLTCPAKKIQVHRSSLYVWCVHDQHTALYCALVLCAYYLAKVTH
jgi:hypothetical protein